MKRIGQSRSETDTATNDEKITRWTAATSTPIHWVVVGARPTTVRVMSYVGPLTEGMSTAILLRHESYSPMKIGLFSGAETWQPPASKVGQPSACRRGARPTRRFVSLDRPICLGRWQSVWRSGNAVCRMVNPSARATRPSGRMVSPFARAANPSDRLANPFARVANPSRRPANPFARVADPPGRVVDPSGRVANPFARVADPSGRKTNPFARVADPSVSLPDRFASLANPSASLPDRRGRVPDQFVFWIFGRRVGSKPDVETGVRVPPLDH